MSEHIYEFQGSWRGGLENGSGSFRTDGLEATFSVPKDMRGVGQGTNPEELIVSASGSCFLITLAAVLQFRNIPFERLENRSKAAFKMNMDGPVLLRIEHAPEVYVKQEQIESVQQTIHQCIAMAEKGCLVSKAMHGNVEVSASGTIKPV